MVVASIVAVIDRAISLIDRRRTTRRLVFVDQVEPVFSDLIEVHEDYRRIFEEVNSVLHAKTRRSSAKALAALIARRRQELSVIREKVNALALALGKEKRLPSEAREFFKSVCLYFSVGPGNDNMNVGASATSTLVELFDSIDRMGLEGKSSVWSEASEVMESVERRWNELLRDYVSARVALLK